jgi:Universal stress protein family
MLRHLVIPLDGSEFSALALPIGIELAAAVGASVRVIGIAASDAELPWTYDHVHDHAERAGLEPNDVEVRVDPQPVDRLLEVAAGEGTVLCLATHDRVAPAAKLRHSIGSAVMERAERPLVVVGPNASRQSLGDDVVVAVDGTGDPEPLLAVGAAWGRRLHSRLRIVTVYEPVPADLRRPDHFTRGHGPPGDPDAYLSRLGERLADAGLDGVDTVAVADPVSVGAGMEQHLAGAPARLLVIGGGGRGARMTGGVARHLLDTSAVPLVVVNRHADLGTGRDSLHPLAP